jgi:hypothetical protein
MEEEEEEEEATFRHFKNQHSEFVNRQSNGRGKGGVRRDGLTIFEKEGDGLTIRRRLSAMAGQVDDC